VQPYDTEDQQPTQLIIGLYVSNNYRLFTYRLKNGIDVLNTTHQPPINIMTHRKNPELAAPAATNTQRRIPTGIRQRKLMGTNTPIAYPYVPSASATLQSPMPSHLVAPHSSAGTSRPYTYTTESAVDSKGRLVVICWSGLDKYRVIDEVRVEVVYKTRTSVVNVQKGPEP
jgi:hypothetical protein